MNIVDNWKKEIDKPEEKIEDVECEYCSSEIEDDNCIALALKSFKTEYKRVYYFHKKCSRKITVEGVL